MRSHNNVEAAHPVRYQPGTHSLELSTKCISLMGLADHFGDDESETRRAQRSRFQEVQGHTRASDTRSAPNNTPVVRSRGYSVSRSQHGKISELRRQLFATLTTASSHDCAAGTSSHTQTETMFLGAATVIRLEGSLAHGYLRLVSTCFPKGEGKLCGHK